MIGDLISHEHIVSFACTRNSTIIVMQKNKYQLPSIDPAQSENRDLIHFYKTGNDWKFVTQSEYAMKKNTIPEICFATRHPIKNFL